MSCWVNIKEHLRRSGQALISIQTLPTALFNISSINPIWYRMEKNAYPASLIGLVQTSGGSESHMDL